jgi:hypothetical protein
LGAAGVSEVLTAAPKLIGGVQTKRRQAVYEVLEALATVRIEAEPES